MKQPVVRQLFFLRMKSNIGKQSYKVGCVRRCVYQFDNEAPLTYYLC
jgi:hypothetical protein